MLKNPVLELFCLNSSVLHLNDKGLGRLAINFKLKIPKLWCEPVNDDYDKEILDENNFQIQKNLTYEFLILDKVAIAKKDLKSSLGSLNLRNVNRLIFGQININSIRNNFELPFSFVSNNIDVLLIHETKIDNTFPVSQFCVPGYSVPFRLERTGNKGGIMLYVKENIPCRMLSKFTFE